MERNQYWRWRTEEERDEAISDDIIEATSPRVDYVHPEEVSQCCFATEHPEFEETLKKCQHYERDWEYDPEEGDPHCCCMKYWGLGFKGLCEMAVINPDETT